MLLSGHVSKIVSILLSKLSDCPKVTHRYATVTTHFNSDITCKKSVVALIRKNNNHFSNFLDEMGRVLFVRQNRIRRNGFRRNGVTPTKAAYKWLHRSTIVNNWSLLYTLLKMGSYSSTTMCQYWDKCLIY